jgi:Na+-driven multidrug efflux pump
VDGVALATIISQATSAVWVLWILFNPKDEYDLDRKELKFYKGITGLIIRTGIPMGVNTALQNFAGLFLQDAINAFGPAVMAGSSASDSITGIIATLPSTMFTGCVSFAGQCYGAKKYRRLDKLMVCSMCLGGGVTALLALFCTIFPTLPLSLFTTDPASIEAGISKLIIVSWGYLILCVGHSTLGVLRGMGKAFGPTIVSIFCFTVVRLLWIWFIFPLHKTPAMLFMCIIVSFACNTAGQFCYFFVSRKKLLQKESAAMQ